jgi:penicillin-binding protein 1A
MSKLQSRRWAVLLILSALAGAGGLAAYHHFARGLPDVRRPEVYQAPELTDIVSADGQLVGEAFIERRKVVPYARIPPRLVDAFIAAEDKRFLEHHGVDWMGVLRAAVNSVFRRRGLQGGSTLTQQTAKALLISTEGADSARRTLRRKIREFILAQRLEASLTKQQILFIYLNRVYLGHGAYGVESAAESYFRKSLEDLTLPEIALLAGLPRAPSRYSPLEHPDAARARRGYVLRRMAEEGMITPDERRAADASTVQVYDLEDVTRQTAPYFVEQALRDLVARYGRDRVLRDGLRVELTMDLEKQRVAEAALRSGIVTVDRRQGFYGPLMHVTGAERDALAERLSHTWPKGSLAPGDYAVGIVEEVDDRAAVVRVRAGAGEGVLPLAGMRWARRPDPMSPGYITRPSAALTAGDVIVVRRVLLQDLRAYDSPGEWALIPDSPLLLVLEQEPRVEGALLSIDPFTGYVAAMVGGYDFDHSQFNRAVQACRQPGSAFKPIVYSAAIDQLGYTAATVLMDKPTDLLDEGTDVSWGRTAEAAFFRMPVTLRDALINSMNGPTVKLAASLGVDRVAEWARMLGLGTPVKRELGSALGSTCTTMWDLANVYALLDRYGEKRPSVLLRRVLDRDGRVLEDHSHFADPWVPLSTRLAAAVAEVQRPKEQVMDERSAYMTVHMMQEVASVGTAAPAKSLDRPAAGKTGTTNDSVDVWFVGFTRDLLAGIWLGYDDNRLPLGRFETGAGAALPVWLAYMEAALRDRPQPAFPVPRGIVFERVAHTDAAPPWTMEEYRLLEPVKAETRFDKGGRRPVKVRIRR